MSRIQPSSSANFTRSKPGRSQKQRAWFLVLVTGLLLLGWLLKPITLSPHDASTPLPAQREPGSNTRRLAFEARPESAQSVAIPGDSIRTPQFVPGQLLIKFHHASSASDVFARFKNVILSHHPLFNGSDLHVVKLVESETQKFIARVRAEPAVAFVEPDAIAHAAFVPNDAYVSSGGEWHLAKIQATAAWDMTTGTTNAIVAVLDSGVNAAHPDLQGKILPGYNVIWDTTDTADDFGHGTAVAGTVAAAGNNSIGVAGVAYGCSILPLKVVNSQGFATYSDIARGIKLAVDYGARVINLSIAGDSPSETLQSAVDYAWSNNVVVAAAAGNSANDTLQYPAACRHVVAVSATASDDSLASFSSYGSYVSLSAPGDNIWTTMRDLATPYGSWRGTSFSSPIVAGVAALVAAANPVLSNEQIVSLLKEQADDLGEPGYDASFGSGRINAFRAVRAAASAPGAVLVPSPPQPDLGTNTLPTPTNSPAQSGPPQVSIQLNGLGHVTPNLDGKALAPGKTYRLRAIPGPGQIFAGWDGDGFAIASPVLSFVADHPFTVTANFVPSPFPPITGSYRGLFIHTNGVSPDNSGYFALNLRSLGGFSARLSLGGARYGFTGRFDAAGRAFLQVPRGTNAPLFLDLRVDLTNGTDQVSGTVSDGAWVADLSADRNVFDARFNPARQAGSRPFVLETADPNPSAAASGISRIKLNGSTRVRGRLADARPFATFSTLAKNGDYPFYLSLKRGSEILLGWANFPAGPDQTSSGTVLWVSTGTNGFAAALKVNSAVSSSR